MVSELPQPDGVTMAKQFLQIKPNANVVLISTQAQIRGQESDLEEIASTNGLKYFRKKGDEEGGKTGRPNRKAVLF